MKTDSRWLLRKRGRKPGTREQSPRNYRGEECGISLVRFLNACATDERERVLCLIRDCQRTDKALPVERIEIAWRIGEQLRQYRFGYTVVLPSNGRGNFSLRFGRLSFPCVVDSLEVPLIEEDAVVAVIELIALRRLDSIRQCKHCQKFLFAKFRTQNLHPECRAVFERSKPKRKEKWASYMREYRRRNELMGARKDKR